MSRIENARQWGFDIYSFPAYSKIRPEKVLFVKGVVQDALSGKKLLATILLTNLNNGQIVDSVTSDTVTGSFLMVLHAGKIMLLTSKNEIIFFIHRILTLQNFRT